MQIREYQQLSLDRLYQWWVDHPGVENVPLLVLPTGSGKSVVLAELVRLLFNTWPSDHPRTVVLVPSKELAEQNAEKLSHLLPSHLRLGYYSASLGRREHDADVIVATIGSIYKHAHLLGNIKCVMIDECFTGDTLISCVHGKKRIDEIQIGECVYTATGIGTVEAISNRQARSILTVRFSDGSKLRTTDNHPFFTPYGWKRAEDLARGDGVIRIQDMPALWDGISSVVKADAGKKIPVSGEKIVRESALLLDLLLKEIRECNVGSRCEGEDGSNAKADSAQAISAWWKRPWNDTSTKSAVFDFGQWMDARACDSHKSTERKRNVPDKLQGGHWEREAEDSDRVGWKVPLWEAQGTGRQERFDADFAWVESVSREELASPEPVFNLQISGHPSYFAGEILVHNCHLVNPDGQEAGRYRKFLSDLARYCAYRVVGCTATPFRGNGVWLTDGEDPLFTGIASRVTIGELLEQGFLSPLVRPADVVARIDTAGISTTSGDYNIAQLSARVEQYLDGVAADAMRLAADRRKWIAFTATVENAQHLASLLNGHGARAAVVCGETPKAEREALIAQFRRGELRCLVTVLALATGFDVPDVDCVIWARPTISPVLYVQGAGRGMRIAPGKTDCLWLDFTDTTERMGPVDAIKGRKKRTSQRDAVAPMTTCDECGERCAASLLECPNCGAQLREEIAQTFATASNAAILAAQRTVRTAVYQITNVTYGIHKKEGSPDSLRVDYYAGMLKVASEWVCFSHGGWAREKAKAWWMKRTMNGWSVLWNFSKDRPWFGDQIDELGGIGIPRLSSQAIQCINEAKSAEKRDGENYFLEPHEIEVNESGKYPEIIRTTFAWEVSSEQARAA